jgi:hypothetical protein
MFAHVKKFVFMISARMSSISIIPVNSVVKIHLQPWNINLQITSDTETKKNPHLIPHAGLLLGRKAVREHAQAQHAAEI